MTQNQRPDHHSNDAGFTLFESLVALSIFSLAAVTTLTLISQNLLTSSRLEARTFAGFVAENVLVETNLAGPLELGDSSGDWDMGGYEFDWFRVIEDTGEGDLQSVTIRVALDGEERILVIRHGFRRGQ